LATRRYARKARLVAPNPSQQGHSVSARKRKMLGGRKAHAKMLALGGGIVVSYPHPQRPEFSAVMRGNTRRNTRFELSVRRLLYAGGYRYRVDAPIDVGGLRLRPDIVLKGRMIAVFLDGCFWHGCPIHGVKPRTNSHYWQEKIRRNKLRDRDYRRRMRKYGWTVIQAWEHESISVIVARIIAAIRAVEPNTLSERRSSS